MATDPVAQEAISVASLALGQVDEAVLELRAVRDRLATVLCQAELERRWTVPPAHRPTCPLDNQPCRSWTCLVDVCVDAKKEGR